MSWNNVQRCNNCGRPLQASFDGASCPAPMCDRPTVVWYGLKFPVTMQMNLQNLIQFKHCPTCNVDHFASSKCARHEAHCKNQPVYKCERCQKHHTVKFGCPNLFVLKAHGTPSHIVPGAIGHWLDPRLAEGEHNLEILRKLMANHEEPMKKPDDEVNHPAHYTQGDIECIDAIQAALTPEEFRGYLKGNVIKYIWRERLKKGVSKAQWYINKMIEVFGG